MAKIFKKKWLWITAAIIILIAGFGIYKLMNSKPAVQYTTEPAIRGNLYQTVTATGNVKSANEISLNFKAPSKITQLAFKEGDLVKAGDVLARSDMGSISAQIKQYEANVAAARANLDKIKSGASAEDIKLTQEQLAKSQDDYASLVRDSETQIKTLTDKTIDSLSNAVFSCQSTLDTVNNDLINNETTIGLLFSDSSAQNGLESSYFILNGRLADIRTTVETAKASGTRDQVLAAADSVRAYLADTIKFLDSAYYLSDKIIINASYTQTKKDAIKADVSGQQAVINSALTALQANRTTLVNSVSSYQSQIQSASNSVAIAQAQLDYKKAGARSFDVASAQASLAQALAQLDNGLSIARDYVITAPIDGKITKINYIVGETSDLTSPVLTMIADSRFEVKVQIPESDITKIKVADKAIITLDAFGSDHPFTGAVSAIDSAQTVIKDVIYYETTISFDQNSFNDQIKPYMTANITIKSAEKDGVLYIPQRAVKVRQADLGAVPQKFVQVLANGKPEEKNIEIGLRGDGGLVEVVSGLNEGDRVITYTSGN